MDLITELLGLIDALNSAGVDYALCGGIALAVHGHPRFTKDIDLLIQESALERIRALSAARGFTLEGGRMTFGYGRSGLREIFRMSKADGPDLLSLDLLLVGSVHLEAWQGRRVVEWRGRRLWVVSRDGLVQMKRLAGRPQDVADIDRLSESNPEQDHA